MNLSVSDIGRREALRRVAALLGVAISAPTLAAMLAGCDAPRTTSDWKPKTLTREQGELVTAIAEHIIPATDTPGARDAGVHRFIDVMIGEYYSPAQHERFRSGLADVDVRARRATGKMFLASTSAEQRSILETIDREAYGSAAAPPTFFRMMKELTLLGYYTSEVGATKELQHVAIPGRFEGCVPLARVGRAFAV